MPFQGFGLGGSQVIQHTHINIVYAIWMLKLEKSLTQRLTSFFVDCAKLIGSFYRSKFQRDNGMDLK